MAVVTSTNVPLPEAYPVFSAGLMNCWNAATESDASDWFGGVRTQAPRITSG